MMDMGEDQLAKMQALKKLISQMSEMMVDVPDEEQPADDMAGVEAAVEEVAEEAPVEDEEDFLAQRKDFMKGGKPKPKKVSMSVFGMQEGMKKPSGSKPVGKKAYG